MPNVFPSNIVLNVVFYVLFVGILKFLLIFSPPIFSPPIFSKLKWPKDAGQRQAPCRLFTFASLRLCLAAPLPRCAFASLRLCLAAPLRLFHIDSLLHPLTEPPFCSFCEQKQRISGAVAHCSTWNTVHFVNRSSEAMEQWPSVSRSIPPCMRVGIGALRPAPLHRCALNRCAIRAPQTMTERSSAYPPHYQAIAPLRLCF